MSASFFKTTLIQVYYARQHRRRVFSKSAKHFEWLLKNEEVRQQLKCKLTMRVFSIWDLCAAL